VAGGEDPQGYVTFGTGAIRVMPEPTSSPRHETAEAGETFSPSSVESVPNGGATWPTPDKNAGHADAAAYRFPPSVLSPGIVGPKFLRPEYGPDPQS